MSSKIDRIANLLASGMKPVMVARIVGVTDSYISQLQADPDFKSALEDLKAEKAEQNSTEAEEDSILKDKLKGAEHRIVDHILSRLDMMADGHAIAALRTIGDRHDAARKHNLLTQAPALAGSQMATVRMVELTMPACAVPELILGKNKEIVSIGGREITPMPINALQNLIDSQLKAEEAIYETL